jgi:hypothetical protein
MTYEVYTSETERPRCPLKVLTPTVFQKMGSLLAKHVFSIIDLTSTGTMNFTYFDF